MVMKPFEKRAYSFLLVLTVFSTIVFQLWRTLFNNFGVEVIELDSDAVGLIQAVREIPGFLSFLVIYLVLLIKEKWLALISAFVLCLGVAVTGYFPSKLGLLGTTLLMSIGFHFYETINQSLSMQYFSIENFTTATANLRRFGALAAIVTGICISALTRFLEFKELYLLFGLIGSAGVFISLTFLPDENKAPIQRKGLVLKKKYWTYYALVFLNGARRQIFTVFALFLLVKRHQISAGAVSLLFVLNNVVNFFIYPYVAKLINKWGEKLTLKIEYSSLFIVFLMYALLDHPVMALILYILDNFFYAFTMATRSYFQKIAAPEDLAPTAGVSFTINHIAAVVIPFIGGLLWLIDWRIPFLLGATFTMASLYLTKFVILGPTSHRLH